MYKCIQKQITTQGCGVYPQPCVVYYEVKEETMCINLLNNLLNIANLILI